MKKLFSIVFFIMIFTFSGKAQQLYFAQSFTTDGKAINARNSWVIPRKGKSIFILFDSEGYHLTSKMLYLYIDKLVAGKYQPWDSKSVMIENNRSWFVYREKFKEAGNYSVYVTDKSNKELARGNLTIKIKSSPFKLDTRQSTPYYNKVKLTFSEWIISGMPFRPLKFKQLSRPPDSVCVYIKHPDSLNTNMLYVDIFKQNGVTNNWEQIDSKKYAILPSWDYAFFKIKFTEEGYYKISIYNEKREFIKSGYLKVVE